MAARVFAAPRRWAGTIGRITTDVERRSSIAPMLMAIFGIGLSSFSLTQMSAVRSKRHRKYFPKGPWN